MAQTTHLASSGHFSHVQLPRPSLLLLLSCGGGGGGGGGGGAVVAPLLQCSLSLSLSWLRSGLSA